jgi:hypothetical protein
MLAAPRIHAQEGSTSDFSQRIGPDARMQLARIVDSARVARLPTAPLIAKSAEGVLKGADDERIVRAVRMLAREMRDAREVMPAGVNAGTLVAAASALHAGATAEALGRLARIPPAHADEAESELGVALVALADLMASRVPPARAVSAVETLMRRHVSAEEFDGFRAAVSRDISRGGAPESVLASRLRMLTTEHDVRSARPGAVQPPVRR